MYPLGLMSPGACPPLKSRLRPCGAASAVLLAALSSCSPADDGVEAADRDIRARLGALRLPEAPTAFWHEPRRETRLVITGDGIDVDNVDHYAERSPRHRAGIRSGLPPAIAADVPLFARRAVRLTGWKVAPEHAPAPQDVSFASLRPILDRAFAVDTVDGGTDATLRVYAHVDAPYGVVVRAIATAAAAGYRDQRLAVRTPKGEQALALNPIGQPATDQCRRLWLTVSRRGVAFHIAPPDPVKPVLVAPAPTYSPPPPGAHGADAMVNRVLLAPGGGCPTVAAPGGRLDLDALAAQLKQFHAGLIPSCSFVSVTAGESMPWSDVVAVLARASDLPVGSLVLGGPVADAAAAPDCAAGIELEAAARALR